MGLLSFLKRENDRLGSPLRAQAYHSTAPSLPPLKGTYPVAGNVSPRFEPLYSPRRVDDTYRLGDDPRRERFTSPPVVPRNREWNSWSIDRPSTAPNAKALLDVPTTPQQLKTPSWLRLDSLRGLPPHMRRHVREDSAASAQRAFDEFADEEIVFGPNPAVNPPKVIHNRHASMQNMQMSSKGFVDILDAQSEIRPGDFRTRVKATGARDYGEDVADRNIIVNGMELEMPPSRAITREPTRETTTVPLHLRRLAPAPQVKALRQQDGELQRPKTTLGTAASEDPYRRTRSLSSATFGQPQPKSEGLVARSAGAAPREKRRPSAYEGYHTDFQTSQPTSRRQAFNAYESSQERRLTSSKKSRKSSRPASAVPAIPGLPLDGRMPSRPGSSYQPRSSSANELGIYGTKSRASSTVPVLSPSSPEFPKLSTVPQKKKKQKKKREPPTPKDLLEDHPRLFDIRPNTARPDSRDSYETGEFSPPSIPMGPSKRHSMKSTTPDFFSGRPGSRDGGNDWGRINVVENKRPTNGRTMTMPAAPSPHVLLLRGGDHGRQQQSELAASYERTRSLVSMRERNRVDEIYDYVPMRTSSLRNWSLMTASTAPTTAGSMMSSNFPPTRPHTSHTANTSVDLPVFSPCVMVPTHSTSSHSSVGTTVPDKSSYGGGYGGGNSELHSPVTSAAPTIEEKARERESFNIDDYLSSEDDVDADSYVTPRKKTQTQVEEGLLFNDVGYGVSGAQLPGLFDAVPETGDSPPQLTTSRLLRHSSYSSPFQSKRHSLISSLSGRSSATPTLRAAPGYGDLDSEDDGGLDSDEARMDPIPGRRGAKRISALGAMYGAIEEEKFEKIDVRTAVRKRKEAKQRKRERLAMRKVRPAEDDEDNLADVEEAC